MDYLTEYLNCPRPEADEYEERFIYRANIALDCTGKKKKYIYNKDRKFQNCIKRYVKEDGYSHATLKAIFKEPGYFSKRESYANFFKAILVYLNAEDKAHYFFQPEFSQGTFVSVIDECLCNEPWDGGHSNPSTILNEILRLLELLKASFSKDNKAVHLAITAARSSIEMILEISKNAYVFIIALLAGLFSKTKAALASFTTPQLVAGGSIAAGGLLWGGLALLEVAKPTYTLLDNGLHKLSCETENALIYYTLNGDPPTRYSTLYTSPIPIPPDELPLTLKARSYRKSATAVDGIISSGVLFVSLHMGGGKALSHATSHKSDSIHTETPTAIQKEFFNQKRIRSLSEDERKKRELLVWRRHWYRGPRWTGFNRGMTDVELKYIYQKNIILKDDMVIGQLFSVDERVELSHISVYFRNVMERGNVYCRVLPTSGNDFMHSVLGTSRGIDFNDKQRIKHVNFSNSVFERLKNVEFDLSELVLKKGTYRFELFCDGGEYTLVRSIYDKKKDGYLYEFDSNNDQYKKYGNSDLGYSLYHSPAKTPHNTVHKVKKFLTKDIGEDYVNGIINNINNYWSLGIELCEVGKNSSAHETLKRKGQDKTLSFGRIKVGEESRALTVGFRNECTDDLKIMDDKLPYVLNDFTLSFADDFMLPRYSISKFTIKFHPSKKGIIKEQIIFPFVLEEDESVRYTYFTLTVTGIGV